MEKEMDDIGIAHRQWQNRDRHSAITFTDRKTPFATHSDWNCRNPVRNCRNFFVSRVHRLALETLI